MSSPNKRKDSTYEDLSPNEGINTFQLDDQDLNTSADLQKSEVWKSEIEMLKEIIKDKEKNIETLKKKQKNKDTQIKDLQEQLEELASKFKNTLNVEPSIDTQAQEEMRLKDQQIKQLKNGKCVLQRQIEQSDKKCEYLREQLALEKKENQQLMKQKIVLNDTIQQMIQKYQTPNQQLLTQNQQLHQKVTELNLSLEKTLLQVKPEQVLMGDNQMSKQIDELKQKNSILQQEVLRLENKCLQRKGNDVNQQIEDLQEQLSYAKEDLEKEKKKNNALKKEKNQFQFTIKNYENKIKSLEIKLIQFEESNQNTIHQSPSQDKKQSSDKLNEELAQLGRQFDHLLDQKIGLEGKNKSLSLQNKSLSLQNQSLKQKITHLNSQLQNLQQTAINAFVSQIAKQQIHIKQSEAIADEANTNPVKETVKDKSQLFPYVKSQLVEQGVNTQQVFELMTCQISQIKAETKMALMVMSKQKDELMKQISWLRQSVMASKNKQKETINLSAEKINELTNMYFANLKQGNKKLRALNLISCNLEQIQI